MGVPIVSAAVKEDGSSSEVLKFLMSARLSSQSSLYLFVCVLISICSVSIGLARNFQRCVVLFWSGAGHFVLNVLDDSLRTNLGISARELQSFSGIANKPDFSVGLLQAPTAFCEEITPKLFCDVPHSTIVHTCKFLGGFDLSYLSFPSVGPAMVVCCNVSCLALYSLASFLVLFIGVPVFTWLVSCFLTVCCDERPPRYFGGLVQERVGAVRALDPLILVCGM